jgi:hypothetical protein
VGGSKDISKVSRQILSKERNGVVHTGYKPLALKERYCNGTGDDIIVLPAGCLSSLDSAINQEELLHGPSRGKEGLTGFTPEFNPRSNQNILRGADASKERYAEKQYPHC